MVFVSKTGEAKEQVFPHLPFQTETIKEVAAYAESVRGSYDTGVPDRHRWHRVVVL
jgi:phage gp29-like protein